MPLQDVDAAWAGLRRQLPEAATVMGLAVV